MTQEREILVVGTDEAGYGPNLGPLLVGASCWRAPAETTRLDDVFSHETSESRRDSLLAFAPPTSDEIWSPRRLDDALAPVSESRRSVFPLLDSKKLYGPSKSLAALERPFMIASALLDRKIESFATVLNDLRSDSEDQLPPWERDATLPLPVDPKTLRSPLEPDLQLVRQALDAANVALLELAARRVQPLEFNRRLDGLGLKSDLIADVTTSLVVETLVAAYDRLARRNEPRPEIALVLCDKLGGRDHYAPILKERFCGADVEILSQGRELSLYRLVAQAGVDRDGVVRPFPEQTILEIRFSAKGESNAPVALASIAAKYVRELSMRLFNEFWRDAVSSSLRPTAGYPVDALRFRAEVEDARSRLGIPDDVFWRRK